MKKFACILLAVATCKASFDGGYSNEVSGGGQGHEGHDFSGGQGQTLALTAQGHDFGGQSFGGGHDFGQQFGGGHGGGQLEQGHEQQFNGGDSYLQAAHDFSQGHQEDQGGQEGHGDGGGQEGQHIQVQTFTLQDAGQDYGQGQDLSGFHDLGPQFHGFGGQGQQDFSGHGQQDFGGHGQQDFGGHGQQFSSEGHDYGHSQPFAVGEHTEVETPVQIPQYKHVTYPIPRPIHVNVPKPILIGVPQPYPVKVPVHKPVAVPVETEISIPVEKPVPYPVIKHVPYPVEKHVPIKIEKTVTVHVPQPYPVKIPIYKTIHHHHKDHH